VNHHGCRGRTRARQRGQAMVEYTVVVAFGILVLITGDDVMTYLRDVIRDNYDGYSFAVSLSEYPDTDSSIEFRTFLEDQEVPDEYIDYLVDDQTDFFNDLINEYLVPQLPGIGEIDLNAFPLNPAQWLTPF